MLLPSKYLEEAVNQLSILPGVGKRTALRLAIFLMNKSSADVENFVKAISNLKNKINYCKKCFNVSDKELCNICSNPKRDTSIICIVQDLRDLIAIEKTQQYNGLYHVLGGIISPIDGVGPDELNISQLLDRIAKENVKEIIFALSATIEGDTTAYYIYKLLNKNQLKITTLAKGVALGNELELIDEFTLASSIVNRIPFREENENSNIISKEKKLLQQ